MKELQGLSNFCGNINIGGIIEIEYIPAIYVDKLTYENNPTYQLHHITEIPLVAGRSWLKLPFFVLRNTWEETLERTEQGVIYTQRVTGILPSMTVEVNEELEIMMQHEYLLRLKDAQGTKWVLGTLDTPFLLSITSTSGDNSSRKGHQIQFQTQTTKRAKGFVL